MKGVFMTNKTASSILITSLLFLSIVMQSCGSTGNVVEVFPNQNQLANSNVLVQVVSPTLENIIGSEQNWLGGQIQDKLKSNLQDYLGMKIVVDAKSESALKKLQQESESESHDENTAIEIGKITTAKFALFTSIRKTNKGYSINADFTDLTTGEQFASAVTKEYIKSEYLYGSTGAIDELTILLADKLGIKISDVQRTALQDGTGDLTIDAQLALARQNEQQYKRLMSQYNEQLRKLSTSTDLNAEENKRKIEAEKALLAEKQKSAEKRRIELENQKRQAEADTELEAQRSIELKTRRDELAKQAEAKAKEIRKLAIEKQGVLGEINLIESKKKALVEIRQSVEQRCIELHEQYAKDKKIEEEKIKNKPYTSVELENGKPTKSALQRRENQIIASNDTLYNKFIADTESVKKAIAPQENALLSEIRTDQKGLEKTRTVSSLGEELKVRYGDFSGEKEGWNTYISLYSEGVLLYNGTFILSYESIVGKKAPNLATELNDAVINEYANNVDMFNSLFARGIPLLQFELDYSVKAETDDKPSEYIFDFMSIRVISTSSGKMIQNSKLNEKINRIMKPEWNIIKKDMISEFDKNKEKRNEEKIKKESDKKFRLDKFMGGFTGGYFGGGFYNGSNSGGLGAFDFSYNVKSPFSLGIDWRFGSINHDSDDKEYGKMRMDIDVYLALGFAIPMKKSMSTIIYTAIAPGCFIYQEKDTTYRYKDKYLAKTETFVDVRAGLILPISDWDIKLVYSKEFTTNNGQMSIFTFLIGGRFL